MAHHPHEKMSREMQQHVDQLLGQQGLGVLSTTDRDGHPYASLIAFAYSKSSAELYFATPKATRKYANLMAEPRVALLINDCVNSPSDFHQASAVTVLGRVTEVNEEKRASLLSIYLEKHAYLRQFAASPSCSFFRLEITGFTMVQKFQNVSELRLDHAPDSDA